MDYKSNDAHQWWQEKGIKFQCQGSGNCCVSRGEYGYVYLTIADRRRFAKYFNIPTISFTKKYCQKTEGMWHLRQDPQQRNCMYLKDKRCSAYKARPTQCRTWPFWPEVLTQKAWKSEVIDFCPGAGKGAYVPSQKIYKSIKEQEASEKELMGGDQLISSEPF